MSRKLIRSIVFACYLQCCLSLAGLEIGLTVESERTMKADITVVYESDQQTDPVKLQIMIDLDQLKADGAMAFKDSGVLTNDEINGIKIRFKKVVRMFEFGESGPQASDQRNSDTREEVLKVGESFIYTMTQNRAIFVDQNNPGSALPGIFLRSASVHLANNQGLEILFEFVKFESPSDEPLESNKTDYFLMFKNDSSRKLFFASFQADGKESPYYNFDIEENSGSFQFLPFLEDNVFLHSGRTNSLLKLHITPDESDGRIGKLEKGNESLSYSFGAVAPTNAFGVTPTIRLALRIYVGKVEKNFRIRSVQLSKDSDQGCEQIGRICIDLDFYCPTVEVLKQESEKVTAQKISFNFPLTKLKFEPFKSYAVYCHDRNPTENFDFAFLKVREFSSDEFENTKFNVFSKSATLSSLRTLSCQTCLNKRGNNSLVPNFQISSKAVRVLI
jgi:hypothetical protein